MKEDEVSEQPRDSILPHESIEAELARLRAEVARLNAEKSRVPEATRVTHGAERWRTVIASILIAFTALLAPLSLVATWAHEQITDTDRYVATVGPLANDPAVQAAISARVSEEIQSHLDIATVTKDSLSALARQDFVPDSARAFLPGLSVPLTNAIEGFVSSRVDALIHSSQFEQAWILANRQAHQQLDNALTGNTGGTVQIANDGTVTISLASLIKSVKQDLIDRGFTIASQIPEVDVSFTIFEFKNFSALRMYVSWLNIAAGVLPILAVVSFAAAVVVSRRRRTTILAGGLAVAASMIIFGIALTVLRALYLNAVPSDVLPSPAAAAIYDQMIQFMRTALRALGLIALAVAIAAFLFAPTGAGAGIRLGFGAGMRRLRSGTGINTGAVGRFLGRYRTFTRVVVVVVGAAWYLALSDPTGSAALLIIGIVVVVLIVLEFLAGASTSENTSAPQQGSSQ